MENYDENRLLIEIAHLYYDKNLTQAQIARKYNISRSSISKMITKARLLGIVEVVIHDEGVHPYRELESELKEALFLKDVICVNVEYKDLLIERLSSAASKYLARKMSNNKVIAMAGGRTCYQIASGFVCSLPFDDVTFVPISGGLGDKYRYMQASAICEMLAHRSGGNYMELHAPLVVDSHEAKKMLISQNFIKEVFDKAKNADLAVVGIGGQDRYRTWVENYMYKQYKSLQELDEAIVGDISYNIYNKRGEKIDCKWHDHLMSLDLNQIKKIKEVVAVAGGVEKADSIYTAIRCNYIDSLITDVNTAKKLISLAR